MLITLTEARTKNIFCLKHDIILVVERDRETQVETKVVTSLTGPQGFLAYLVLESPEQIADKMIELVKNFRQKDDVTPALATAQ